MRAAAASGDLPYLTGDLGELMGRFIGERSDELGNLHNDVLDGLLRRAESTARRERRRDLVKLLERHTVHNRHQEVAAQQRAELIVRDASVCAQLVEHGGCNEHDSDARTRESPIDREPHVRAGPKAHLAEPHRHVLPNEQVVDVFRVGLAVGPGVAKENVVLLSACNSCRADRL